MSNNRRDVFERSAATEWIHASRTRVGFVLNFFKKEMHYEKTHRISNGHFDDV
jgi:hypothetical protein